MFALIKLPTLPYYQLLPSNLISVGLNLGIVQLFTRGPYDDKAIFTDCSKYRSIENVVISTWKQDSSILSTFNISVWELAIGEF